MGKASFLVALALAACGHMSDYDRCRVGASFERDATVRAIRLDSCEQVANREQAREMHNEEMAQRRAELAEVDQGLPPPAPPRVRWLAHGATATAIFMFRKPEDYYGLVAAAQQGVADAELADGFRLHGGISIDNGTPVEALDFQAPLARVRVLAGTWEGTQGWVRAVDLEHP